MNSQETQTGTQLATCSILALKSDNFTDIPGNCQKFVREVCDFMGGRFGATMDTYRGPSALATMHNFASTIFDVWSRVGYSTQFPAASFLQEGDILYKGTSTSGPFGHTGIVCAGHRVGWPGIAFVVIENSSYHVLPGSTGDVNGAKGYRTLSAFGPCEMIVRLSETAQKAV